MTNLQIWRLLLIDDDEDDYLLVRATLGFLDLRKVVLEWASNYEAGCQRLATENYDAVLVDYDLGARTGVDLIREFTTRKYPAPLILYSGRGSYEVDVEAMQAGATSYIVKKEITPLLLERSIRYAIERKQIEATLRAINEQLATELVERKRAEADLQTIMDAAPAYIWISRDPQCRFMIGNKATYELIGMQPGENVSMSAPEQEIPTTFRPYHGEEEIPAFELPMQMTAFKGIPVRDAEFEFVLEDGSRIYLAGNTAPLLDTEGKPAGAVGVFIDITRHKYIEKQLREAEAKSRDLINHAATGIYEIDLASGKFMRVNDAMCHMLGYSREELLALDPFDLLDEPSKKLFQERIRKKFVGEEISETVEYKVKGNDGREYDAVLNVSFMEYDGQPGSVMVIAHDITERKLAEVEIHQSQQELQMYAERLKRSNQALEDFAFAASHDLKEPLRKVQSFGEILKTSYAHLLDEKGRDYINRMQAATNRMQNMIDGLLEYSRIGMDTQPMTPVDLQEVASEVVSDLETKIEETGGQVVFDSLPTLEADPLQMRMLLQNLLANGLKFHRPDVPPLVKVSAVSYASGWVELVFEDNGVGFKMERVEELFQPFRRLHGRSEFEGSGVGLAICQKIAERHGGAITARSAPGEGSTFIVKLPIRQ